MRRTNWKRTRAYTEAEKKLVFGVLRAIRDMSGMEVQRVCGVSNSSVSKWRTRQVRVMSMASALKVATALGCRLEFVEVNEESATTTSRRTREDRAERLVH